jgi:hypothetical protein
MQLRIGIGEGFGGEFPDRGKEAAASVHTASKSRARARHDSRGSGSGCQFLRGPGELESRVVELSVLVQYKANI